MGAHLLSINHLSTDDISRLFSLTDRYMNHAEHRLIAPEEPVLPGAQVFHLFFEHSTRTLMSFEVAAKRLGAQVTNFNIAASSFAKGESVKDTILTLNAMEPDVMVIRHVENGMAEQITHWTDAHVINAGDGCNEHPTQALLDAYTILKKKGRIKGLEIAICGDLLHSRVARSNIALLTKLGAKIRAASPPELMMKETEQAGVTQYHDFEEAISGADAIMLLRIQKERMQNAADLSEADYHKTFGLTRERLELAKPDVIVLHPGPINRGVEIDEDIADDPKCSMILAQVKTGVALRQAVLTWLMD